jgi:hypothetical protein
VNKSGAAGHYKACHASADEHKIKYVVPDGEAFAFSDDSPPNKTVADEERGDANSRDTGYSEGT